MLCILLTILLNLEADFTQTKQVALMREPQVSTGHLVYKEPDYMQWTYLTPERITWEINGEKSNVNPQIQRLLRMIMSSISGANLRNSDDFDIQTSENTYTLTPKKRDYKRLFQSIRLTLNPQDGIARRVEMTESNGDVTIIEFTHVTKK